jgi:hypothetical protein
MRNICIPEGARLLMFTDAFGTTFRVVKLSDQSHCPGPSFVVLVGD